MPARHAEVAGAGFAGLTVATALRMRGWTVRVHEADTEFRAFGAGIYMWENGLRVLRAIGAYDEVIADIYDGGVMESRLDGKSVTVQRFGEDLGCRMVCMTREHLYSAMLAAARRVGVELVANSEVTGATPDGVLTTAAGRKFPADLVVGADGVKSQVRDSLGLEVERSISKDGVIRLLTWRTSEEVRSDDWNRVVDFWTLEPRLLRVLYTPCNEKELYLCMMAPFADVEASAIPVRKEVWSAAFPYLAPVFSRLGSQGRYDLYQTSRLRTWSVGRVAILGDAAHAMPPTLGQGAGLAMVNALGLAVALENAATIEEGLKIWERTERQLTDHTQDYATNLAMTRKLADGHSWDDDALRAARHVPTGAAA
jgi:2-methyl-3-hydroxypyridine 5-carboxylic acid dioxygenase